MPTIRRYPKNTSTLLIGSISDEAMNFIISSILSKRPEKGRIRPGTPWYRSESSVERSATPLTVYAAMNGNVNRDSPAGSSAVEENHGCCWYRKIGRARVRVWGYVLTGVRKNLKQGFVKIFIIWSWRILLKYWAVRIIFEQEPRIGRWIAKNLWVDCL